MSSKLDRLLDAARERAEDSGEPDHEVGDLQDILRTCWRLLTPAQRQKVLQEHTEST